MAEADSSSESDRDENVIRFIRVLVNDIADDGVLSLAQLLPRPEGTQNKPLRANMPVMSEHALGILNSYFTRGKVLDWIPIAGSTCHYNIFFYLAGSNVTLDIVTEIMNSRLPNHVQLPAVNLFGVGRISPLCEANYIYVHMQPEYVLTLTYYIYLRVDFMQANDLISPAKTIELYKKYILSRGYENYRVIVSEEVTSRGFNKKYFSPANFDRVIHSHGLVQLDDNSSRKYGDRVLCGECGSCKTDESDNGFGSEDHENTNFPPPKKVTSDEVYVFPIDFGGPIIRVHRRYLFDIKAVDEKLRHIPDLSFPVIFTSIDGTTNKIEERSEGLKIRQETLLIQTVAGVSQDGQQHVQVFTP